MALQDYKADCEGCTRCSVCKWIPFFQVKRGDVQQICPSISKYNFHAYSGGGKLNVAYSIIDRGTKVDKTVAEVAYRCNLCGACDYTCKVYRKDLEPCEVIEELRLACVREGQGLPEHRQIIASLQQNGNSIGKSAAERLEWTEGLNIKTVQSGAQGDAFFYAGCKTSFDTALAKRLRNTVRLLQQGGLDVITAGSAEQCCGSKALQLGYIKEGTEAAQSLLAQVRKAGAKKLITSCAHCYSAFKYYYPRFGITTGVEVLHVTECLSSMLEAGKLTLNNSTPLHVTYHDPCNLGRRSEPFIGLYPGSKKARPATQVRTGAKGVYEPPRKLLTAIQGVTLTEMDRTKGYSWCCGAGAGVPEAYPELTEFAGGERVKEAGYTGAQAIVTACPWCEESLKAAVRKEGRNNLQVLDLAELVAQCAGGPRD